jgi:hypothetical protein
LQNVIQQAAAGGQGAPDIATLIRLINFYGGRQ